jgi:hypothetical protein
MGLKDDRSDGKEMGMGKKSKRNRTELRSEREPCNSTIGKQEMTAGAGRRGRFESGIVDGHAG